MQKKYGSSQAEVFYPDCHTKKYRIEARKCNNPIFLIFIVYFVLNTTQTGLSAAISVPL